VAKPDKSVSDHYINRIFREVMGMQQSITLVDEPEMPHP